MDPDTIRKLVDCYKGRLSDLYTSSYSCQISSNAYGTTLDFFNLDLNTAVILPCFYNLPVFQVAPPSPQFATFASSPRAAFSANTTAKTPEAGLIFLPHNLLPVFTELFCLFQANAPPIKEDDVNSSEVDSCRVVRAWLVTPTHWVRYWPMRSNEMLKSDNIAWIDMV